MAKYGILAFLIFFSSISNCFSQSQAYNLQFSQGYFHYSQANYSQADLCYKQFMKSADKVTGRHYSNMAKNKLELEQIDSSQHYFLLASKNGFNPAELKRPKYANLFHSTNKEAYLSELSSAYDAYHKTLDWKKIEFLIRILEKDLGIRRVYYQYMDNELLKDTLQKAVIINQGKVFQEFKRWIIANDGLPTMEEIGYSNYDELSNTLMHFVAEVDGAFEFLEPYAKQAMQNGDLHPRYYARIVDFYYFMKYEYEIYGSEMFVKMDDDRSTFRKIHNIKEVDERRQSIGLISLKHKAIRWKVVLPKEYINSRKKQ